MSRRLLLKSGQFGLATFSLTLFLSTGFHQSQLTATQTNIDATELPTRILEIPTVDQQGKPTFTHALVPDWTQISFSQMPPISQSGSNQPKGQETELNRTWTTGQTPDQFLTLGDISPALKPELLSVGFIAQQTGLNLEQVALSAFPLIGQQTLNQLIEAIPLLAQFKVEEIAPVADLFTTQAANLNWRNQTLTQVLSSNPQLGELKLGQIDLSSYSMSSLPNLESTQLGALSGWQTTPIQDVPGLNTLPLSDFPNSVTEFGDLVMRIDTIYGPAEGRRTNTISGSDVQGFSVNCQGSQCAYIELDDLENMGRRARGSLEGKQWMSGKYQEVEGGWGCLQGINGGKEPTGRLPFGSAFKVVVMEPDEQTDTVSTALFFRFCSPCGCSPYFIGPVPFFTYRVNSPIFVGVLEPSPPGFSSIPTQANVSTESSVMSPKSLLSSPSRQTQSKLTYGQVQGVNIEVLSEAIASLESSNLDLAIGPYVCADNNRNCGRALGKYQFMSYNEYASGVIASKPGGETFLAQLAKGYQPTETELFQYFPPADQEAVFAQSLIDKLNATVAEIDPTTGQLFEGERLIERVAQKHFGGDSSQVDGQATDAFGRLTLKSYGLDVLGRYQVNGGTVISTNTSLNSQ